MPNYPGPATALLDVTLTARRSLSQRGFRVFFGIFLIVSLSISLPFVLCGAWPIAGFFGLDALLLYFGFQANFRAARAYETISVSSLELRVEHVSASGQRRLWRFHPWWTRLMRTEDEEFGLQKLTVVSRERALEVAISLGACEKEEFARILYVALERARRGPYFS